MRKLPLLLIVNVAVFCTLLVVVEVTGQIFYYLSKGRFIFSNVQEGGTYHKMVFELHPYLVGRLKKDVSVEAADGRRISTTTIHTRWTGAPENDSKLIRVAVLGGSTTHGTGLTDTESWPALLQEKLGNNYSVINYGVPGYSSVGAIIQMALVVPEIRPHFVVLYEGWNDIQNYHESGLGPDYYSHGMSQYEHLRITTFKEKSVLETLNDLSAIVRFAEIIRSRFSDPLIKEPLKLYDTPDPFVDRLYIRNLKTLKLLSKNISSYALFVPQVLNYAAYVKEEGSDWWSPHIKNSAVPKLMDRFNSFMQSTCSKDEPDCVYVNEVLEENWEPADFLDHGHFSKKGGEKFSEIIRRVIHSKSKGLSHEVLSAASR